MPSPCKWTCTNRRAITWAIGQWSCWRTAGFYVWRQNRHERLLHFVGVRYVAASIQYRLFPLFTLGFPDSIKIFNTAVKAVGDMKAAVRHFRDDAATVNQFRAGHAQHFYRGILSRGRYGPPRRLLGQRPDAGLPQRPAPTQWRAGRHQRHRSQQDALLSIQSRREHCWAAFTAAIGLMRPRCP